MLKLISGPPLVKGKFYIYGVQPEKYFLVDRFFGFNANNTVIMQTAAGAAEIVGDNLKFFGPYETRDLAVAAGFEMFPNAAKQPPQPSQTPTTTTGAYGGVGAYYYPSTWPQYPYQWQYPWRRPRIPWVWPWRRNW